MEFKIDTKDTFSTITPVTGVISANLADELSEMCGNMRQSGSQNFIIDLEQCKTMEENAIAGLVALHEECYSEGQSLVFTGISEQAMTMLKSGETDLLLNIAPKMIEAIDIISMEILERDLFGEEG